MIVTHQRNVFSIWRYEMGRGLSNTDGSKLSTYCIFCGERVVSLDAYCLFLSVKESIYSRGFPSSVVYGSMPLDIYCWWQPNPDIALESYQIVLIWRGFWRCKLMENLELIVQSDFYCNTHSEIHHWNWAVYCTYCNYCIMSSVLTKAVSQWLQFILQ